MASFDRLNCLICFDWLKNTDANVSLNCGHVYHQECFSQWSQTSKKCPTCRADVTITTNLFFSTGRFGENESQEELQNAWALVKNLKEKNERLEQKVRLLEHAKICQDSWNWVPYSSSPVTVPSVPVVLPLQRPPTSLSSTSAWTRPTQTNSQSLMRTTTPRRLVSRPFPVDPRQPHPLRRQLFARTLSGRTFPVRFVAPDSVPHHVRLATETASQP
ncbi:hypothetical protein L596_013427 [Steinernema carpocapsae]|uniref:RING-type domain-containing protein n=1 Tax=Steinernema carpocapsae TaxID=34508 RepID=A0A4U5P0S2_STECR|nr:hypothetical protein L596_013427 [Steinernema carpocapsae]